MIIHSPDTLMPPPYQSYIAERAEAMRHILETFIPDDVAVQLCPRAVAPTEVAVGEDGLVYGVVVHHPADGLKAALYKERCADGGMAYSLAEAVGLSQCFFDQGNRVRLKDPRASDSQNQHTADGVDEVVAVVDEYPDIAEHGLVVMPYLQVDEDGRYTVGRVNLGPYGDYTYVAREFMIVHPDGSEVRGGGDLALARSEDGDALQTAAKLLRIPESVVSAGKEALERYAKIAIHLGCASVDVLVGKTDSSQERTLVVDLTSRVNGFSGEEVLGIQKLVQDPDARVVLAYDRLYYNPNQDTPRGKNDVVFIDEPSLLMVAGIGEVIKRDTL